MLYYRLETVQKNGAALSIDIFIKHIKKNWLGAGDQRKVIVGLKSCSESFLGENRSLLPGPTTIFIHAYSDVYRHV